jgi:heme-binding uptake protein ChaN (Tiki superfamily)
VPRSPADPARRILIRQRRAAERVRREVLEADGSLHRPYFRALDRRLRDYERVVDVADVVAQAALADLVYVSDFHALPGCQRFAAELIERLAARVPRLALGVEFAYVREQPTLDARQERRLGDAEFLRRIRFARDWGYEWSGYRELLDRARASGVAVHALDTHPRRGFAGLERRDQRTARRIASLVLASPGTRLVVLYGESHLTADHLPRAVKRLLKDAGVERREIVVFQNPDRVYWRALEREPALPGAVRIDRATYAVFHTSPIEKYEAYRQALDRWNGDGASGVEVDLTPAVHHVIHALAAWLGIRAGRLTLRHRAGWTENLEDALPEVYTGSEARALLRPVMHDHGRTALELREARKQLERAGALYEPRANAMFVVRYAPATVAAESARFLRAALTGRLFIRSDDFAADVARTTYGAAYTEALARVAAHLLGAPNGASHEVDARARGFAREVRAHRRLEDSTLAEPPPALLARLRRSRPLRRAIASALGHRLGEALVARLRRGELEADDLRRLFVRPLDPRRASRTTLRLLRDALAARPQP